MEEIENKIIELLNEADEKLSKMEFESLAESIIDYIDKIARSKTQSGGGMVDATGVKVLLETEADHTGSNPVLTANNKQ